MSIRLGIIGVGNMGTTHARNLLDGKIKGIELAALCDVDDKRLAAFPKVPGWKDSGELIRSGKVDAVLIATPHYSHTTIGIDALGQGLHVLVEKPLSVHKADCERLISAYERRPKPGQVFAAMFNQRTDPRYQQLKRLIDSGELGAISRITWIITDWFRTEAYYASGGWRATWSGEGGGVLINQCPHQLDLWTWLFGLPKRVRANVGLGRRHAIEVEDEVTAFLDYESCSGVFITTTGEAPGTNRLEVAAERGKVVIEHGEMHWARNVQPMAEFSRTTTGGFTKPDLWHVKIPVQGWGGQHNEILQNFADAIAKGAPLMAPAVEGIRSVELGNAMLLSGLTDRTLTLPLDGAFVDAEFAKLQAASKPHAKQVAAAPPTDFASSFGR
jgi:predicted dehydrogenase